MGRPRISANLLLAAIIVGAIAFGFAFCNRDISNFVRKPVEVVVEKADCLKKSALSQEELNPELSAEELDVLAIAAGVAIDVEGEVPDCEQAAIDAIVDVYIRHHKKNSGMPYERITTKSRVWLPGDWVYPKRWRDRPLCWIRSGREATIKRLKPIIAERLKRGPGPGCGDRILRPGWHFGGWWANEAKARRGVEDLAEDSEWQKVAKKIKEDKKVACRTSVRCSP